MDSDKISKHICKFCDKEFFTYISFKRKFCSNKCRTDSSRGILHSENHRKKISINNSRYWEGKTFSEEHRKKLSEKARKSRKPLSEETKRKIGLANSGEKQWNWKGGVKANKTLAEYNRERYYLSPYKKLSNQKRLSLKRKGGYIDVKIIQTVYEDNIKKYGTLTCYLCLKPIVFKKDSLEHKIPLSRDGTNEYNNLAIAHISCNAKKHNKTEEEYKKIIKEVLF